MRMLSTASPIAMNNSMIGENGEVHDEDEEYAVRAGGEKSRDLSSMVTVGKENHRDNDIDTDDTDRTAQEGDIVTLEMSLVPENGFVPEPLFDSMGKVSFVLGWGNYLPGLHQLVLERGGRINALVENVSLDAGWGRRRADLLFTVSKETLQRQNVKNVHEIQAGSWLQIPHPQAAHNGHGGGTTVQVLVDQVTQDAVVLDANQPLSGSSYSFSFRVLSIDPLPSLDMAQQQQHVHDDDDDDDAYQQTMTTTGSNNNIHHHHANTDFQVATFALGCYWGAELAFSRQVGVVGTRVGYSQGITKFPTYQQVCSGTTKHRESVMVIYNPTQVSYTQLLELACQRLDQTMTTTTSNSNSSTASFIMFHEDDYENDDENNSEYPSQYKPGFYYHTEEQYETARTFLEQRRRRQHKGSSSNSSSSTSTTIELLPAGTFYNAEEYHQQYLYKGGQSTRKGAKETIRCYG